MILYRWRVYRLGPRGRTEVGEVHATTYGAATKKAKDRYAKPVSRPKHIEVERIVAEGATDVYSPR